MRFVWSQPGLWLFLFPVHSVSAVRFPCRLCHPGQHLERARGGGPKPRSWHLGQPHALCLSISCCSSGKGTTTPGRRGLAHGLLGARSRVGPLPLEGCLSHLEGSGLKFQTAPCLFAHLVPAQEPDRRSAGGPEPPLPAADEGKGEWQILRLPSWIWLPSPFPPPFPAPSFTSVICEIQQTLSRAHYSRPIALKRAERSCT